MKKSIIIAGLIVFTMTGCVTVYNATNPFIPNHKEKGDAQLRIGTGTETVSLGGSYALSDHSFISANTALLTTPTLQDDSVKVNKFNSFSWEIESGYFESPNQYFTYGAAFGVGMAHVQALYTPGGDPNPEKDFKGSLGKLMITPYFTFGTDYFETGLATRLNYIMRIPSSSKKPFNGLFWEPTLNIKAGGKNIKFSMQTTLTFLIRGEIYVYYAYDPLSFSFGLEIDPVKLLTKN